VEHPDATLPTVLEHDDQRDQAAHPGAPGRMVTLAVKMDGAFNPDW
jgi:hypothetical protein